MRAKEITGRSELEELRGQIERWRHSRPRPRGMPEVLWQEACAAARRLGTYRVARELGVRYESLKQRVEAGNSRSVVPVARQERAAAPGFIDLGKVAALRPLVSADQMVLELVAPDGTRLTIRTREAGASVLGMIHAFQGRS
jgi:hypothetical protein